MVPHSSAWVAVKADRRKKKKTRKNTRNLINMPDSLLYE
jgi:hypothetical protein